jgi:pimeloyl-ACP methyl ester carboxylesterase
MGGYGTWTTAALYPNKFAALVPVAGGIVPPFQIPAFLKRPFRLKSSQFWMPPILIMLSPKESETSLFGYLTEAKTKQFQSRNQEKSAKRSRKTATKMSFTPNMQHQS